MAKEAAAKEKPTRHMTDALRVKRGRAVDDMQQRVAALKKAGAAVPAEWVEKLQLISDTDDAEVVEKHLEWCDATLPPKEYVVEEITWQTFAHFSFALLNDLTLYVMRNRLLSGDDSQSAPAVVIMQQIAAIRAATDSPVVAMNELAKQRNAATKLPGFEEPLA